MGAVFSFVLVILFFGGIFYNYKKFVKAYPDSAAAAKFVLVFCVSICIFLFLSTFGREELRKFIVSVHENEENEIRERCQGAIGCILKATMHPDDYKACEQQSGSNFEMCANAKIHLRNLGLGQ